MIAFQYPGLGSVAPKLTWNSFDLIHGFDFMLLDDSTSEISTSGGFLGYWWGQFVSVTHFSGFIDRSGNIHPKRWNVLREQDSNMILGNRTTQLNYSPESVSNLSITSVYVWYVQVPHPLDMPLPCQWCTNARPPRIVSLLSLITSHALYLIPPKPFNVQLADKKDKYQFDLHDCQLRSNALSDTQLKFPPRNRLWMHRVRMRDFISLFRSFEVTLKASIPVSENFQSPLKKLECMFDIYPRLRCVITWITIFLRRVSWIITGSILSSDRPANLPSHLFATL